MAEPLVLLLAAAAIFGAAFVQGVTGFGHALVAIGFLSLLFGAREAVLVLSLLAPPIALAVYLPLRRAVDRREALALALPLCLAGMPLGLLLFGTIPEAALRRVVGVLLILSAAVFLSPFAPKERPRPLWLAVAAGFLSGLLNGLASTGGPPLILYLWSRDLGKDARMAVLQAVFVAGSLAKVAALLPTGFLTPGISLNSAVLLPPLVVGVILGHLVYRRVPAEALKKITLLLLAAMGVALL
ncbi:MAG: sulfite exporter TauE/SafE family protein [Planctomycetes bacterium]|jgi:hypothetical protein|nr:sulfite exporter TauE/SafE family protein [Planctomycetota bacterium]